MNQDIRRRLQRLEQRTYERGPLLVPIREDETDREAIERQGLQAAAARRRPVFVVDEFPEDE